MKKRYILLIAILIAAGSFLAGSWVTYRVGGNTVTADRKVLHYVDPMNPAFKSDKPGIAPCGMPLEPVYADQGDAGGADLRASMPPGTIRVSPEKQQLIGVKTATVEKAPWSHTLRVLGRVAPDETRVYRIKAAVSGWIQEVPPVTTGSLVKGNELLATFSFYSAEFRTALLAYLNAVRSGNISHPASKAEEQSAQKNISKTKELRAKEFENIRLTGRGDPSSQVDYYRQILVSYGVSEVQLREMERARDLISDIEILAPAAGFVLFRNVSPGQRFDKGEELFRIADLSQVWILGDIFETEASYFKPGMRVKMELPYQKKILYAKVSPVLPQFDPATRTLKVRLVADNPGYVMRPDMLVNVELPVNGPPAIIVPVGAVLDSGLKKTVFVDKGNGFFEPRQVEIGRTLGERVEIARGLMPGEKVVVSGNFLIDSEARMQQAASGITGRIGRDPVCRMNIDEDRAKAEGNMRNYKGKSYFFCSPECLAEFDKDPVRYLTSEPVQAKMQIPMAGSQGVDAGHSAHDMASKPPGVKKAPAAHDGMAMPDGETGAMPGMPAPHPKAKPKTGEAAPGSNASGSGSISMPMPQAAAPMPGPLPDRLSPSPAGPGMGPGWPASPGPGGMPMPQNVMPGSAQQPTLPGPGQGGMPMPQGAAPMPASPGSAQIPGGISGEKSSPVPSAPGMNQGPPDFPAQGIMPGPMPQGTAPMSGAQTGEMTSPAPAADTRTRIPSRPPRINPRWQYRVPGTGSPGAVPMPGGKAGEMPQSATDHPDGKP